MNQCLCDKIFIKKETPNNFLFGVEPRILSLVGLAENAETIRFIDLSFVEIIPTKVSSLVHQCCQRYQVITDCLRQSHVSVKLTQLLLVSVKPCGLSNGLPSNQNFLSQN